MVRKGYLSRAGLSSPASARSKLKGRTVPYGLRVLRHSLPTEYRLSVLCLDSVVCFGLDLAITLLTLAISKQRVIIMSDFFTIYSHRESERQLSTAASTVKRQKSTTF